MWDDYAAESAGGTVCYFVSVDSVTANRLYFASGVTTLLAAAGAGDANPDILPLLGPGEPLPQIIFNDVNGSKLNVAMSDLRPEDAKLATIRALQSPAGSRIPYDRFTGLGYGPNSIGTPIQSSQSAKQSLPVDFTIAGPDPITLTGTPRAYSLISLGASPVLVLANVTNTAEGHLGDGNYAKINRSALANALTGGYTHIRQLATVLNEPDAPLGVFQASPLAGDFNVMEYSVPLSPQWYFSYNGPATIGQETGVDPTNTACAGQTPCAVESGNPFWHFAANGATRGRVIGTNEMLTTLENTPDSLGYAYWGFGNFAGLTNLHYLTVDGVDPLYASSAGNPNGAGVLPQCTGSGGSLSCPLLSLPNVVNGSYPVWSMWRIVYDSTDPTVLADRLYLYATAAATQVLSDFVPASAMGVFHSHFHQLVVTGTSDDQAPNNGFKPGVPETGGDMGGQVLTIQTELDYITDTAGATINGLACGAGCQQVDLFH